MLAVIRASRVVRYDLAGRCPDAAGRAALSPDALPAEARFCFVVVARVGVSGTVEVVSPGSSDEVSDLNEAAPGSSFCSKISFRPRVKEGDRGSTV